VNVLPLRILKLYVPPPNVRFVDVSAVNDIGAVMVEKSRLTNVYAATTAERRAIASVKIAVRPSDAVPVTTML
jgi:bifunctional DNase/RNase